MRQLGVLMTATQKRLLLALTAVTALATATPTTSSEQRFQGLGFLPGANSSSAHGVNADGTVVVGDALVVVGDAVRRQAFRWVNGTMTGLGFATATGVSADGTVVVGTKLPGGPGGSEAVRWVNGTATGLGFLPGGTASSASGVNADGTVVVGLSTNGLVVQAVRWVNGTVTGLGFPPSGSFSEARGVSANGKVVVGEAVDASGREQAFRWTAATRMQSVLTLLQAAGVVTMAGWQLRSANGVSADGTVIVGDGVDPLGNVQAWIARLPEDNEDCKEDENELEGARSKRLIMEDRVLGY